MRKTIFVSLLLPLLALGLIAAEPADNTLTAEQKAALAALDVRLAGVEALAAKIDDPNYKAEVARQIEDLKKRRLAIEKNFDPGLYEMLMHSVISRYQIIALWLKPAPLPAPPAKPSRSRKSRSARTASCASMQKIRQSERRFRVGGQETTNGNLNCASGGAIHTPSLC
jgi:hypothetical protein